MNNVYKCIKAYRDIPVGATVTIEFHEGVLGIGAVYVTHNKRTTVCDSSVIITNFEEVK